MPAAAIAAARAGASPYPVTEPAAPSTPAPAPASAEPVVVRDRSPIRTLLVVGVILVGAFVVGIFAWIFLAGFLLIGAVVLSVWVWRQRRRFNKFQQEAGDNVLEAEYEVVHEARETREGRERE